ncbi:G_PROTEIN_RECEP_F1_2 domain-containing protein [Caenorhabditis elegans]|uniref:G_PROTEIN_RECEP_F1_2 domain-containing protein n=1 Tax=Caenorhabditis elegans TaxID=6239 RepID=Q3Y412_CAEEL|nr:G_PROTEIN_RECEP_F1_2 domain-containing protein [Caenorhabditis elegans]CCD61740.1 G_PROTEIN_RECEP_F1_2 domain-containing protein [Caenorhabditis elegans]|eukprot:NP_494803.3 Serpentine Receptor, class A (alpha) [Caenorhabditis elegans]
MNLSDVLPIITNGSSCASEFEIGERTSYSSRLNIFLHNLVIILTMVFTRKAVKIMLSKSMFSTTTRNLLFYCMNYYIFHDIYFAFTMNWSLYRSIEKSNNSCGIMFKGSECFSYYVIGIFVRVLLLTSQFAVTIEKLIVTFLPNSDLINSGTLNIMTFIMSVIITSAIRPPSYSQYNNPNCFQQIYPEMETINYLIHLMIGFDLICFPINFLIMIRYRRKFLKSQNSGDYNLKSRYNNKSNMNSSIIVSFISFVQTLIYTIYILGFFIVLNIYVNADGLFYGNNVALWFYSFPIAGLALPCSIILSYTGISIKRKNKITVMNTKITKSGNYMQDAYFKSLADQWNSARVTEVGS